MTADGIERLGFSAIPASLQQELRPAVDRLGYFGEFFQVIAGVPDAVGSFMAFTKAVKAPLDDAENEVIALAVCSALGDRYERVQHERLSVRLGLAPEWVAAAEGRAGANASLLDTGQRALRDLALAIVARRGTECTAEVRAVSDLLGSTKAAAALLQTTRFMTIATLCNALQLNLPVASIFDAEAAPA